MDEMVDRDMWPTTKVGFELLWVLWDTMMSIFYILLIFNRLNDKLINHENNWLMNR